MPLNVLLAVGARPNFIKIAPLMAAFAKRPAFSQTLIHTGQHYDDKMSGSFFAELGIAVPDHNLNVGSASHAVQTAEIMRRFEPLLAEIAPDLLVVVGDVNSTLACALVAAKEGVPVAHVEAGLRSRDRSMPEEINRIVTDQLAELLLTPSADADANLMAEGIAGDRVHRVGNIMIDTLHAQRCEAEKRGAAGRFGVAPGGYALVTLHRPSNVDDPEVLRGIFSAFAAISRQQPVVFPMHPRTRASAERFGLMAAMGEVLVIEPLPYPDMLGLMATAGIVLTDSGGVQEETTALGIPCVTLRDSTERPVTVTEGTNTLVPSRTEADILSALPSARAKRGRIPDLWDGRTADRIADVLERWASSRSRRAAG